MSGARTLAAAGVAVVALAATGAAAPRPPVHPLLPWHAAVVDANGKLLAWHKPRSGLGYDRVLRLGWGFLERRVPRDSRTGLPVNVLYAVFDGDSLAGAYWQHNPAFLNATLVDSLVAWYPYSGDRRAIATVRRALDHQLTHGTTPVRWAWGGVPFATSCAGDRDYGRCLAGMPRRFYGGIEPDKVGLLGLGYLRFYELTGGRRYLSAALRAADALARHMRQGDDERTPWPFRVDARTGRVVDGAQFGGAVVAPIALFDELLRVGVRRPARYARARALAWRWIRTHPLEPSSPTFNRWSGFYEDVAYNPRSRNQVPPTLVAQYLLTHPAPGSIDADWRRHVDALLRWVRTSFGRGPFRGAQAIDEQRAPGKPGCCSPAGLGSTTSRWGALHALLAARTGDAAARETAFRSLNYATYFARPDGRVACCGRRPWNTYWFSDGYGDYLRSFNWAMAALPELAPARQTHLLGSTSVVQRVAYGRRRVVYRTFSRNAEEALRLRYRPVRILADGRALPRRTALDGEGYTVAPLGRDFVVRVRHEGARHLRVLGSAA